MSNSTKLLIGIALLTVQGTSASAAENIAGQWTAPASDETRERLCPRNTVATYAACAGEYCDNMSLWCEVPSMTDGLQVVWRMPQDGYWTNPYVSEEQPAGVMCHDGYAITAIRAQGEYSDA